MKKKEIPSNLLSMLIANPDVPFSEKERNNRMRAVELSIQAIQGRRAHGNHWRLLVQIINMVHVFNERDDEYSLSDDVTEQHEKALEALKAMSNRVPIHFTEEELEHIREVVQIYGDIMESAPAREIARVDSYASKTWNNAQEAMPNSPKANAKRQARSATKKRKSKR